MINKNNTTTKEPSTITVTSLKVLRVKQFENGSIVFDVEINGIKIYNCHWIEGSKDGREYAFPSFPSTKGKDGKYYPIVSARLSDADIKKIEDGISSLL